jgi:hypothetical protein
VADYPRHVVAAVSEWDGLPPNPEREGRYWIGLSPAAAEDWTWQADWHDWCRNPNELGALRGKTPAQMVRFGLKIFGPVTLPGQIDAASFAKGAEAMKALATKLVRYTQETQMSSTREERRYLSPRRFGNEIGTAYADGIEALPLPTPE